MSESSSKNPFISIIVPVYNVASYLEKCINTLQSQTYQNYEVILVDDGSTDKGRERISTEALYEFGYD